MCCNCIRWAWEHLFFRTAFKSQEDGMTEAPRKLAKLRQVFAVPQLLINHINNVRRSNVKQPKFILHYIDKEFVAPENNLFAETFNPSTGESLSQFPIAGQNEILKAVEAALKAASHWASITEDERRKIVHEFTDLLQQKVEVFEEAESIDRGQKPEYKAKIAEEVSSMLKFSTNDDQKEKRDSKGNIMYEDRLPIGVVAIVTDWTTSLIQLLHQLVPALLSGNTVVIKASGLAPLTGHFLAHELHLTGIPKGVCNIVFGEEDKDIASLVNHEDVGAVVLVCSDKNTVDTLKENLPPKKKIMFTALPGNNAPFIVFEDADLDCVIPKATEACFLTDAGQNLYNVHQIFVHKSILETFKDKFVVAASQLSVGKTEGQSQSIGPLISREIRDRAIQLITKLKNAETELLYGGNVNIPEQNSKEGKGFFMCPTIFAGSDSKEFYEDIIQGPVVNILSFETEKELLASACVSNSLVAASLWTKDVERARHIAARLQTGFIFVNDWKTDVPQTDVNKAVDFYTILKNINIKL